MWLVCDVLAWRHCRCRRVTSIGASISLPSLLSTCVEQSLVAHSTARSKSRRTAQVSCQHLSHTHCIGNNGTTPSLSPTALTLVLVGPRGAWQRQPVPTPPQDREEQGPIPGIYIGRTRVPVRYRYHKLSKRTREPETKACIPVHARGPAKCHAVCRGTGCHLMAWSEVAGFHGIPAGDRYLHALPHGICNTRVHVACYSRTGSICSYNINAVNRDQRFHAANGRMNVLLCCCGLWVCGIAIPG